MLFFLAGSFFLSAQDNQASSLLTGVVDSLYREDQFYLGLSFNLVSDGPSGFSQDGFSGGFHAGFIRDMPFNKRRNLAVGLGLGYSVNVYNTNLYIGEQVNGLNNYQVFDTDLEDGKNRFFTHLIEVPFQLRWRSSTPTKFTFWRIYTGIKLGYIFSFNSVSEIELGDHSESDPTGLERWRYVGTFAVGNGSFSAFINYSLNPLFSVDNPAIPNFDLTPIKIGIEFYFL